MVSCGSRRRGSAGYSRVSVAVGSRGAPFSPLPVKVGGRNGRAGVHVVIRWFTLWIDKDPQAFGIPVSGEDGDCCNAGYTRQVHAAAPLAMHNHEYKYPRT